VLFRAVNNEVQEAILSQLKAGRTRVRLSAAQLPPVAFESRSSDLYWGFRGTQGLTVTGRRSPARERTVHRNPLLRHTGQLRIPGRRHARRFSGPPMRYLQTGLRGRRCTRGEPAGSPDSITVNRAVQPAGLIRVAGRAARRSRPASLAAWRDDVHVAAPSWASRASLPSVVTRRQAASLGERQVGGRS